MKLISDKIHQYNKNCYRTEILRFDSGLFDSCIDMTYVVTMENSDRYDEFMEQLKIHKIASKVIVQYNKGYRNCKKKNVSSSAYDLTDALRNIFTNALKNNYKSVLVLEDDFFMDKTKYSSKDIDSICKFIRTKHPDVYNLGTIIHLSPPSFSSHPLALIYGMSHSIIYSERYMKHFIKDAALGKIKHVDQYWNKYKFSKYSYKYPIIFQTWPETTNMKDWGWTWRLSKEWLNYWKLDKTNEHYRAHWQASWEGPWLFIAIIILFIILIILFCKVNKRNKNII